VAKEVNLEGRDALNEDSRFQFVIDVTGIALAPFNAVKMHVRTNKAAGTLLFDASSFVSIDTIANQLVIDIPGSATAGQTWTKGVYDLKVYNSGNSSISPVRVIQGTITLDHRVSV
jgi:hypothetical protein